MPQRALKLQLKLQLSPLILSILFQNFPILPALFQVDVAFVVTPPHGVGACPLNFVDRRKAVTD